MPITAETVYQQLKNAPNTVVYEVSDFTEFLIKKLKNNPAPENTATSLMQFQGLLKNSSSFNGSPLDIQKNMRDEWH